VEEVQIGGIGTEGGRGTEGGGGTDRWKRYRLMEEVQIDGRGTDRWNRYRRWKRYNR
jgi:hypothetical protein